MRFPYNIQILLELLAGRYFAELPYPHPRVLFAKSAQAQENKRDSRNYELRRVRNLLKTKDRVLRTLAKREKERKETAWTFPMRERAGGGRWRGSGGELSRHGKYYQTEVRLSTITFVVFERSSRPVSVRFRGERRTACHRGPVLTGVCTKDLTTAMPRGAAIGLARSNAGKSQACGRMPR